MHPSGEKPKSRSLPVVFELPGLKPDTRLSIFEQEYHVHSQILRLYSAYFRKFLDSPDKIPPPDGYLFRYDYVSVVDEDGEWGLEVAVQGNISATSNNLKVGLDEYKEQLAILRLLQVFYRRPYVIESFESFARLVGLADFYCALPALSSSLYQVLCTSCNFKNIIVTRPFAVLKLAKKLRHPTLLREALVYTVAEWEESEGNSRSAVQLRSKDELAHNFEGDKDLEYVVLKARSGISDRVRKADREILKQSHLVDSWTQIIRGNKTSKDMCSSIPASCYRELWHKLREDEYPQFLDKGSWKFLMQNNSAFSHDKRHEKWFMCAEVEDEDLPWPPNEIDW